MVTIIDDDGSFRCARARALIIAPRRCGRRPLAPRDFHPCPFGVPHTSEKREESGVFMRTVLRASDRERR